MNRLNPLGRPEEAIRMGKVITFTTAAGRAFSIPLMLAGAGVGIMVGLSPAQVAGAQRDPIVKVASIMAATLGAAGAVTEIVFTLAGVHFALNRKDIQP